MQEMLEHPIPFIKLKRFCGIIYPVFYIDIILAFF